MNAEILEMLHVMQIPVFVPKNSKLSIQSTPLPLLIPTIPIETRYCLIVGQIGNWEVQKESIQQEQFNMLKRLILALNWDFGACMIAQVNLESEQAFVDTLKQSCVEKMILFGNDLEIFEDLFRSEHTLKVISVPSVEALMTNPLAKREAWGRLLPHKIT